MPKAVMTCLFSSSIRRDTNFPGGQSRQLSLENTADTHMTDTLDLPINTQQVLSNEWLATASSLLLPYQFIVTKSV